MKIEGHIKITKNGKVVFDDHNLITDGALSTFMAGWLSIAGSTNKLYRMAIGTGGYSGTVRTVESDIWNTMTTLATILGSQPIAIQTSTFRAAPGTLTIENNTVITADDYWGGSAIVVNEVGLVAGTGTPSDIVQGALSAADTLFAYQTIDAVTLDAGETMNIDWNIVISKGN
jgi:hypothetical protein